MSVERRTALYETHLRYGARMVLFGGWRMPVSYSGISAEHVAVRTAAGVFDVSHMGEFLITGGRALELVQTLTLNDAGRLANNQAQYSAMATDQGTLVDDVLVYRLAEDRFMLVVNAANIAKDLEWIHSHNRIRAEVRDVSDETALFAVQGPRALDALSGLVPVPLAEVASFHFVDTTVAGVAGTLSRTGYTGEDGFEFYFAASHAVRVWEAILEAGRPYGILPVGLGARNTLRLEAALLLYGRDIDETTTAFEAGLGWMTHLDKGPFVGREALAGLKETGPERKLIGFEMEGREIARDDYPVLVEGREAGRVTSGAPSITLGKNIGLAYLPRSHAREGTRFQVRVRRRLSDARVVSRPFYRRRAGNES